VLVSERLWTRSAFPHHANQHVRAAQEPVEILEHEQGGCAALRELPGRKKHSRRVGELILAYLQKEGG